MYETGRRLILSIRAKSRVQVEFSFPVSRQLSSKRNGSSFHDIA